MVLVLAQRVNGSYFAGQTFCQVLVVRREVGTINIFNKFILRACNKAADFERLS